ncbi:MAG: flagellar hook-basal body complex protein FliE [Burkholderiaceae bacterium]
MSAIANSLGSAPLQAELARIEQDALRLGAVGGEPAPGSEQGFAQTLAQALHQVDGKEQDAADKVGAVERGESDDLVGAMLASQDAGLSFSMLMQVRNKVAGAVEELIKLQL